MRERKRERGRERWPRDKGAKEVNELGREREREKGEGKTGNKTKVERPEDSQGKDELKRS